MSEIGIVGVGIAGLHLGLFLRQHGVATAIYADRTPEQLRSGRLLNNQIRFAHTRAREWALAVDFWTHVAPDLTTISLAVRP
jgi:2-polyprenyl-6-methoxyphenol hydroxylase-like FAD-dependent oxidoreductase